MKPGDTLRGDYLLHDVAFSSRRVVWLLGRMPDGVREFPADSRLVVLDRAKGVITQPGRVFDAAAIRYTRSRNAVAQWRRALLTTLIDEGFEDYALAFDACLDLEDGSVSYRPRGGIRFFARNCPRSHTDRHPGSGLVHRAGHEIDHRH